MLRRFRILVLGLLPLMVGCPGPYEPGYNPNQPPDQNSLGFGYIGESSAVAGQWRISWGIDRAPAVTAPTRIRFQGPGTLVNTQMIPIDLSREYDGAGGLYLPPGDVTAEGATAKVGCEVFSPFTKHWEKSPDYDIRVTKKTTPMDYFTEKAGLPANAATVKVGEKLVFALVARPRPAPEVLQMQYGLVPPQGFTGDAGSLLVEPIGDIDWRYTYTAPTSLAASMDVIVRTTIFDPWIQQTRTIDFTIHLTPN